MIALALDDPDAQVRRAATEAVSQAGYGAELEREEQRRALERLHARLEQQTQEAHRLEHQLDSLARALIMLQVNHDDLAHEAQGLLREREGILAEGWTETARHEVELGTVQDHLLRVLERADAHEARLRELKEALHRRRDEDGATRRPLEGLRREQQRLARDLEQCQAAAERAAAAAREARAGLDALLAEPLPVESGDEGRRLHAERMERLSALRETVAQSRAEAEEHRNRAAALTQELARLTTELEAAREREEELEAVRDEMASGVREGGALRQRLTDLEERVRTLRQRGEAAHTDRTRRLEDVARRLEACEHDLAALGGRMQALRTQLAEAQAALEASRTAAQQVARDLDLGRQHYEALSVRAAEESRRADGLAAEQERRFAERRRLEQESLLWYAYNIEQALARHSEMQEWSPEG